MKNDSGNARALVSQLRSRRAGREGEWQMLADWLAPHRGVFSGEDISPRHTRRNREAFNQYACYALLRGASGMTSGMTPRNVPWFRPSFTESGLLEAPGARQWLDILNERMQDCLAAGGFYQAIHSFNIDLLWAGCALIFCEAGTQNPARYECPQIGTFSLSLDECGLVEACERVFTLSAQGLAEKFGEDALSPATRSLLKTNPWQPVRVTHLARRAPEGARKIAAMPYESLFWEEGSEDFLSRGGYYEIPYFFTRWHDGPSPYGTGPGDDALMDSRQLDLLEQRKLEGLGKIINPPVMAPPNYKNRIDLSPGGMNYLQQMELIRPILDMAPYTASLSFIQQEIQVIVQRLENELLASIFASMPVDQRPADMSATEFLERKREALQQIGPVISAYEPNVLTPLLAKTARILDRAGLTPPAPPALEGVPLAMKVEFISPMANALRQTTAESARALLSEAANLAQATGQPQILDKIDFDQAIDELATALGAPGSIIRSDPEVAQIRQQRAQAQQQAEQIAQAQAGLNMAGQAQQLAIQQNELDGDGKEEESSGGGDLL